MNTQPRFFRQDWVFNKVISTKCLLPMVLYLAALLNGLAAEAQNYTVIKSFGDLTNVTGIEPGNAPAVGPDGTLYGTTWSGGLGTVSGTIYKINTNGTGFAILKYFTNSTDGAILFGGLILCGNTLYGTALKGGSAGLGTIFSINTDGTGFAVLKSFTGSDGQNPNTTLALNGGTLYGTAWPGQTVSSGNCEIFSLSTNGTGFNVLYKFGSGASVETGLIVNSGRIYGVANDNSAVLKLFSLNTNGGSFNVFYSIVSDSSGSGGFVLSNDTIYCEDEGGGVNTAGSIFSVKTNGTEYTLLHSFSNQSKSASEKGNWGCFGRV